MQSGMLFHSLSAPGSGVEIEQIICTIRELLDLQAFQQAWDSVINRHAVLRTRFAWEGADQPVQFVEQQASCRIKYHDWRGRSLPERETALQELLDNDRHIDFTMSEAPLMRLLVLDYGADGFGCIWTFHHAILDGRSFPIVLKELFAFYEAICAHHELDLPAPAQYGDYLEWLQKQDFPAASNYWKNKLAGFTAPTPLSIDSLPSVRQHSGGNAAEELRLSAAVTASLEAFVSAHDLTLNTAMQAAWGLLLHHYSGEVDVVFGATRACRYSTVAGADAMVGIFINTLPVRVQVQADESLLGYMKKLRQQQIDIRPYEHTPLPDVQRWSDVRAGFPLFESIVVFEKYLLNTVLREQGGEWLNRDFEYRGQTGFPITLIGYKDKELILRIEYDRQRFTQEAVHRMLGHLNLLLEGMNAEAEAHPALAIPYVTAEESRQLLYEWNPRPVHKIVNECVHERFQQQVEKTPDAVALTFEQQTLRYRELDLRANRLAHELVSYGVGPDVLVGMCVERSVEMVVGILAILKAGGGYVPIDPAYPADRIAFILEDAQVPVLLTQASLKGSMPSIAGRVIDIDSFEQGDSAGRVYEAPPDVAVRPENVAYIIYTSGSTGKPKGVVVTHGNVVRLFDTTDPQFGFGNTDVWTLFHSYAFDFSVWEIWGALLYGGRLVVVPYWISRSPESFYQLVASQRVTVLNQTPSAFRQFITAEETNAAEVATDLRYVIFGGEALDLGSLKPWIARHGDARPRLINMYGITETTVHVTYRPITAREVEEARGSVIGAAIPDLDIYLLDGYMRPVPLGVKGEIYVGGEGVAKGYLNRPDLTAEKFIDNPFRHEAGGRLYRTGDLARYLPNRDLEYLGRCDKQVKIRGFRIETGEIESRLKDNNDIVDAVVIAADSVSGDKKLIAYCVPVKGEHLNVPEIKKHLGAVLPGYMVPATYVEINVIPLTENGKTDYRALPVPDENRASLATEYVAPRSDMEHKIAGIWSSVLNVSQVGINDNFFDLGGDSILVVKVAGDLGRLVGHSIQIHKLFEHPTVQTLADFLSTDSDQTEGLSDIASRASKRRAALAQVKRKNIGM